MASTDANWSLGHKPTNTETPVFDAATSANNCSWDYAITDLVAVILTRAGGSVTTAAAFGCVGAYAQSGWTFVQGAFDVFTGAVTMDGGTLTGNNGKNWNLAGDILQSAGTIGGGGGLRLVVSGPNRNITILGGIDLRSLTILDSANVLTTFQSYGLTMGAGTSLNISVTKTFTWNCFIFAPPYGSLEGVIDGLGTFKIMGYQVDVTGLGDVNCPLIINRASGGAPSWKLILDADTVIGNSVTILSGDAIQITTLDLAGYSLSVTTITASTRGIISSSVAGAKVFAGTGGILVEANGSLDRTNISFIKDCGKFDTSAGATTTGTDTLIMCGRGSRALKMAAGQTLYNLAVANDPQVVLGSDITVTNECVLAADNITKGAFALNHTGGGDKWYDRRRRRSLRNFSPGPLNYVGPGDDILGYLSIFPGAVE